MRFGIRRGAAILALICAAAGSAAAGDIEDYYLHPSIPREVQAVDLNTGQPYYAPPIPYGHYAKDGCGKAVGMLYSPFAKAKGLLHHGGGKACGACGGKGCNECGGSGLCGNGGGGHGGLFHHGGGKACGACGGHGCGSCGGSGLLGGGGGHGGMGGGACGTASVGESFVVHGASCGTPVMATAQGSASFAAGSACGGCGGKGCGLCGGGHGGHGGGFLGKNCGSCGGKGCGLCGGGHGQAGGFDACGSCGGKGCGLCKGLGKLCKGCGGKGCALCKGLGGKLLGLLHPHAGEIEYFVGPGGPVPITPGYVPYVVTTRSPRDFFAFPPYTEANR